MMDLSKGIIPVEGFTLWEGADEDCVYAPGPDRIDTHGRIVVSEKTTLADFQAVYDAALFEPVDGGILTFAMLFLVDGTPFDCAFFLDEKKRVREIQMIPCIRCAAEDWDRDGQQRERCDFCDRWLADRLGMPTVEDGATGYILDGLQTATVTHSDQHNGGDGGFISIADTRRR